MVSTWTILLCTPTFFSVIHDFCTPPLWALFLFRISWGAVFSWNLDNLESWFLIPWEGFFVSFSWLCYLDSTYLQPKTRRKMTQTAKHPERSHTLKEYVTILPKLHTHVRLTQLNVMEGLHKFGEKESTVMIKETVIAHLRCTTAYKVREHAIQKSEDGIKIFNISKPVMRWDNQLFKLSQW